MVILCKETTLKKTTEESGIMDRRQERHALYVG